MAKGNRQARVKIPRSLKSINYQFRLDPKKLEAGHPWAIDYLDRTLKEWNSAGYQNGDFLVELLRRYDTGEQIVPTVLVKAQDVAAILEIVQYLRDATGGIAQPYVGSRPIVELPSDMQETLDRIAGHGSTWEDET